MANRQDRDLGKYEPDDAEKESTTNLILALDSSHLAGFIESVGTLDDFESTASSPIVS